MNAKAMTLILLISIMITSILSGPAMAISSNDLESSRYKCATFLKEEIRNAMIRDIEDQGLTFEASRRSPDRVEVGDTRTFWDWDLSVMPPGNRLVDATCRGIGDYTYVFVADDQWGGNVEETDIGLLLDAFENVTPIGSIDPDQGIYENDVDLFGDVPDALDNDPKIYILLLDIPGYGGYEFDGYFNVFDQYPDDFTWGTYGEHSNEVEMLYINSDIRPVTADATLSVVAHELEHMIHWNYDTDEASWVDESMAEAAMTVNGYYTDQAWVADFMSNPNIQLTQSTYVHYGACLLWGTYLYEQFGDLDILREIVAEPLNGEFGIVASLGTAGVGLDFNDVVRRWVVANLLDEPSIGDGRYGYNFFDLPPISYARTITAYPSPEYSGYVASDAAEYIRMTDSPFNHIDLNLGAVDPWYHYFQVIKFPSGDPASAIVEEIPLAGSLVDFRVKNTDTFNDVILVASTSSGKGYTYSVVSGLCGTLPLPARGEMSPYQTAVYFLLLALPGLAVAARRMRK